MRAETKRVGWHAVTELMGTQARQEDVERHSRKERESCTKMGEVKTKQIWLLSDDI